MRNKTEKHKNFSKHKTLCIISAVVLIAIAIPTGVRAKNNLLNSQQNKQTVDATIANKEGARARDNGMNSTNSSTDSSTKNNQGNKKPSSNGSTQSTSSATVGPNSTQPKTSNTNPPTQTSNPAKKISNWSVTVFQKNITTCGTSNNPCQWPNGLVMSLVAIDTDNGTPIQLANCSMTAVPIGFSLPQGSFSANPSVYSDGGTPICGGGYDFPKAGQYRLDYEIWPADSVNMDLRYRGGTIMNFYLRN